MRLINSETLKLEDHCAEHNLRYAILSHVWEHGEVIFSDIRGGSNIRQMPGYYKILKCCIEARSAGLPYVWVDTCCIDKSSSSELQEAINSMYRWYKNASVCYVYLSDFDRTGQGDLRQSQWFTRGWTLQELIAPDHVEFYDRAWQHIGDKISLVESLVEVTRIPRELLKGTVRDLSMFTVAERMSWAVGRKTRRTEDRAYSLMGLFGVNMPMLYGEGENAFLRLQEEILKRSSDQSIFAWTGIETVCLGLLARSPDDFPKTSASAEWCLDYPMFERRNSQSLTNEGLSLELSLTPWRPMMYLAVFNYRAGSLREGIFIKRIDRESRFVRVSDPERGDLFRGRPPQHGPHTRPYRAMRVVIVHSWIDRFEHSILKLEPVSAFNLVQTPLITSFLLTDVTDLSLRSAQFGPVNVLALPEHTWINRMMLGFDFDYWPVIVIERTGHECCTSTGESSSQKSLDHVSCMESEDWTILHPGQRQTVSREDRRGHWTFKLNLSRQVAGYFSCLINMGSDLHDRESTFLMRVSRMKTRQPWDVSLEQHRPP